MFFGSVLISMVESIKGGQEFSSIPTDSEYSLYHVFMLI